MSVTLSAHPQQATQVVTFASGRWMRLSGLAPEHKAALIKQLTIVNPRRMAKARYSGFVDASEPKYLTGYQDAAEVGSLFIAPGASANAWRYLRSQGVECAYTDTRPVDPTVELTYNGQERDYQIDVNTAMLARPFAMAVGPCGSGKTDIAIRMMVGHRCRWLIIVEKRPLRKQWMDRLRERTNGVVSDYVPGRKNKWNPKADFVVALAQALIKHPDDVVALAAAFPGVTVDECHHASCTTFTDVLSLGDFRYRKGFTATPVRSDGTTPLMFWWVGPEAGRVDRDAVEESGHLLRARLRVITTDWVDTYDPDEPGDDYRLKTRMYANSDRLAKVCWTIANLAKAHDRHVIVPVDSIAYGYAILQTLRAMGSAVEFCHAKPGKIRRAAIIKDLRELGLSEFAETSIGISKRQQNEILERVANGATRVLIATSLADEGLDLPILDTTVIATPSGSATRIEQQMGRSCRPGPGKNTPLCVYVVDPLVQREEVAVDPETGETTRKIHRIFVNRFRRNWLSVFKKTCDFDELEVRRVLKGDRLDEHPS